MLFWRFICFVLLAVLHIGLAKRVRRGFCSTRGLQIQNGDYSVKSGNSRVDFTCNEGFYLYGTSRLVCFGTKWSADPPICISNTCPDPQFVEGMRITKSYNGSIIHLSCDVMFQLEGATTLICNGANWSAPLPTCREWIPPTTCDFESPSICSWTHHHDNDVDWRWHSGSTRTSRTGPTHDHTLGAGGNGHYMYFESSSPTRTGHVARLQSPLYPSAFSWNYCFQFWYHFQTDEDDDGWFKVYIVPDGENWTNVSAAFSVSSNQGDVWKMHEFGLGDLQNPFTINFVGEKGNGYRSDFAFDDVKLYHCAQTTPVTNQTTPTIPPTSTTRSRTQPPTTSPTTSTTTMPRPTPTMPPSPTTAKATTTNSSPARPRTSSMQTTPPSSSKRVNRSTTERTVSDVSTAGKKRIQTTTADVTMTTTGNDSSQNTKARAMSADDNGLSAAAYAGICVGLFVLVILTAVVGYLWYRRQHKVEDYGFSANNPCYIAANGEDPKVCFADDDFPYNTIDD